jgi:hypothetical protein
MKKLSMLAALGAVLSNAVTGVAEGPRGSAQMAMPRRLGKTTRRRQGVANGYPEQSQRQALRGFRRAQGGPGIEFAGGSWQPKRA